MAILAVGNMVEKAWQVSEILGEKKLYPTIVNMRFVKPFDEELVLALAITFACEKGNIDRCVEGIWKIISKMQENEYPDSKLRAAKRQLLGQMVISSDNGETQCLSMGKSLITYGTVHDDEYDRAMIDSITAQDLRKAAIQIFNPERTSSLIFL